MNDLYVYKILAYADELTTQKSSADEFQAFLMGTSRPDFADRNIIAVKFVFSIIPDCLDDAEETAWYINPNSVQVPPYCAVDIYGSKLPAEYPPYLLLLAADKPNNNVLLSFDIFRNAEYDYRSDYLESFKTFSAWYKKHS